MAWIQSWKFNENDKKVKLSVIKCAMDSDQNETVLKNLVNSLIDEDITYELMFMGIRHGNEWILKHLIKNNS